MTYKNGLELPSRCEYYRTRKGWTVEELAEKANVSADVIELIESGGRIPPNFTYNFRVCMAFGLTDDRSMWKPIKEVSKSWVSNVVA